MNIPHREDRYIGRDEEASEDQELYGPILLSSQNPPRIEDQVVSLGQAKLLPPPHLNQDQVPQADPPLAVRTGVVNIFEMAGHGIVMVENDENGRPRVILVHRIHQPVPHAPRREEEAQQLEILQAQMRVFASMELQCNSEWNLPTNNYQFCPSQ